MKATETTVEKILKSGKFPAIKTTETMRSPHGAQTIVNTTVFKLDKVNAITLARQGVKNSDCVIIRMDGGTDLQYDCGHYKEAEDFFKYILDKW